MVSPTVDTRRAAVPLALAVVYLVWGSTYLAIRVLVDHHWPPLLAMGFRFVVAGILLSALVRVRYGRAALHAQPRALAWTALVAVLLLTTGNGTLAVVEQRVSSGLAALLVAAVPLWLVVLRLATADPPRAATLAGTLIGFAGLTLLASAGLGDPGSTWRVMLLIGATVSWSIGSFLSGRVPSLPNDLATIAWQMLVGGLALIALGFAFGEGRRLGPLGQPPTSAGWLAWVYLVLFGSLLAFSCYVWLLHHTPISLAATYAYVNPIVAVVLGTVFLDETVTVTMAVGGAITVGAVAVVVRSERGVH